MIVSDGRAGMPWVGEPDFETACTQMHEHDPVTCAPEIPA
jgi:hypothetical protein